jgi:integrase
MVRKRPILPHSRLNDLGPSENSANSADALKILHQVGILLQRATEGCIDEVPGSVRRVGPAQPHGPAGKAVKEIVEELLWAKERDGLSKRYVETVRSHLHRFARAFQKEISSITASQIEQWLRNQNVGPRARNNIRGSIVTLFHFARKHGYLPKGETTEAEEVTKAKDRGGKIGVLNPEELARILEKAPRRIRLFLALGAFTGMRSSEILRLEWSDVNFERRFITVAPEKAKTATRRLVPILPNLVLWLAPYRAANGLLFKTRRDADRAIAFAKACQVDWPNNALRHSYATYRLAATADAARVALEMGNSPQKLMRNYRELADEKDAAAWFSISPRSGSNG